MAAQSHLSISHRDADIYTLLLQYFDWHLVARAMVTQSFYLTPYLRIWNTPQSFNTASSAL